MKIGDLITIADAFFPEDTSLHETGTIIYIEEDEDELVWIYVRANTEYMNTISDPKFPQSYWRIIEKSSELIVSINPGVL